MDEAIQEEEHDARIRFLTYQNYVEAFCLLSNDLDELRAAQRTLPIVRALGRGPAIPLKEFKESLRRGWLTLHAIRSVPLDAYPQLAAAANLWVAVQAYYAVHGVGVAAIAALTGDVLLTHSHFLSKATSQLCPMLPFPFNITCVSPSSGTDVRSSALTGTMLNVGDAQKQSGLSVPSRGNAERLIAKAIYTTHANRFEEKCAEQRRKKRRKKLSPDQKQQVLVRLSPTSFFNFLYRLRLRSNYDDPMMFMAGQSDDRAAVQHYMNVYSFARTTVFLLQEVPKRILNPAERSQVADAYRRFKANMSRPKWPS